jgi:hypothetical protein
MPECGDSGPLSGPTSLKAFLDGAQRLPYAAPQAQVYAWDNRKSTSPRMATERWCVVKLTVVHDGFEPGSAVLQASLTAGLPSCQSQNPP